ncbi:hypothetical protein NCS52_01022700 [Fusarium sp. LHS14.1]|nr:hypothetical protein NCS52_01022700 [Fusarium sp. LHS14.1]
MASVDALLVRQVLEALRKLDPFPVTDFMARLFNLARNAPDISPLKSAFQVQEHTSPFVANANIDTSLLNRIAVEAIVTSIGKINASADKAGFNSCIKKPEANQGTFSDMTQIASLLLAQYINGALASGSLPPLAELYGIEGFADAFTETVSSDKFISIAVAADISSDHRMYSTAMVYMCGYLEHGPGFVPLPSSTFDTSVCSRVVSRWATVLLDEGKATAVDVFNFCSQVVSAALAPEYDTDLVASEKTVRKVFMKKVFQPALARNLSRKGKIKGDDEFDGLVDSAVSEFQGIVVRCQIGWRSLENEWYDPVSEMATKSTQASRTYETGGTGSIYSLVDPPVRKRKWQEVTTTTGRALADWLRGAKKAQPEFFHIRQSPPNVVVVNRVEVPINSGGGCFRPGTLVAIKAGQDVPIESIEEGTTVLTHAHGQKLGICSDEDVTIKVSEPYLVGFNDEGVFATPGHVFHTTTGLRAVDPELAIAENAWLDVGRLQPGHVLLRLTEDRTSYNLLPIKSIQVNKVPEVTTVHGIHLREGDRSYHANGFLVAVNYPEITIRSVAAALDKLAPKDRLQAVSKLTDLRPLFEKLGITGVEDLLRHELTEAKKGRLKTRRGPHVVRFREMRRSLALTEATGRLMDSRKPPFAYQLPAVEIFDGILKLDGVIVPRTALDPAKSSIRWSRPLEDTEGYFEHGILVFSQDGFDATGAVLISDDANPADTKSGVDYMVSFSAASPLPKINHTRPKSKPMMKNAASLATKVAPPKPAATLKSAVTAAAAAIPVPIPSIPSFDQILVAGGSANGSGENEVSTTAVVTNPSELEEGFTSAVFGSDFALTLQVDQEKWPANVERFTCINPVHFGMLDLGVYHSSQTLQHAVKSSVVIIPELDQLLETYNSQAPPELQLPHLYESVVRHDSATGGYKAEVQITAAPFIASISDQFQPADDPEDTVYPTKQLTFVNQLGTDITLPLLFSEAEFDIDFFFETASGAVWEYNPAMVGALGDRYFFEGSWLFSLSARSSQARVDTRAQISREAAVLSEDVTSPSPATALLSRAAILSQNDLNDLLTMQYDAEGHQAATRTMFEKLMYYFMEDGDRENFTTQTKPSESEFSPNLLASLSDAHRTWLTHTYCKAFVSFSISRINKAVEDGDGTDANPGFLFKLTPEQKDKIWYFWSGNGETCLASSTEFNEINERVSLFVLREILGPDFATRYLADNQGPVWADLMVKAVPKRIRAEAAKEFSGENVLHKWCTIAHCLAPSGVNGPNIDLDAEVDIETAINQLDYSSQIFLACMQYLEAEENKDVINTAGDMMFGYPFEAWIQDAIGALIDAVYDGTSDLDQEVRDELLADFDALREQFDLDANATVEEFKQTALSTTSSMTAQMAFAMANLPGLFNVGLFQGIHNLVNYAFKSSQGIPANVSNMLYGTMVFAVLTFWIMSFVSGEPIDFLAMPPDQKASFMTLNIRIVTTLMQGCMAQFKASKVSSIGNAVAATAFDDIWQARATNNAFRSNAGFQLREAANRQVNPSPRTQRIFNQAEAELIDTYINDTKAQARFRKANRTTLWNQNRAARNQAWGSLASESSNNQLPKTQMSVKWIARIGLMASVAAFCAYSVILVRDIRSGNLTRKGRALARAQIAVMGIAVATEAAGLLVTTGLLSMALPFVGALLAITGLVLAVLFGKDDSRVPPEPEPSPAEVFIRDEAIPLADSLVSPPTSTLTYALNVQPGSDFKTGKQRTVRIQGKNMSSSPVSISETSLTFSSGGDDVCVFSEPAFVNEGMMALGTASDVSTGEMAVERLAGTASLVEHSLVSDTFSTHTAYQAIIGPQGIPESKTVVIATEGIEIENELIENGVEILNPNDEGELGEGPPSPPLDENGQPTIVVPPGGGFTWVICGTVNPIQDNGPGESWFEVTELRTDGDKTLTRFFVQRT